MWKLSSLFLFACLTAFGADPKDAKSEEAKLLNTIKATKTALEKATSTAQKLSVLAGLRQKLSSLEKLSEQNPTAANRPYRMSLFSFTNQLDEISTKTPTEASCRQNAAAIIDNGRIRGGDQDPEELFGESKEVLELLRLLCAPIKLE